MAYKRKPTVAAVNRAERAETEQNDALEAARTAGYAQGFAAAMDRVLSLALSNGNAARLDNDTVIAELSARLHKKVWERGQ